MKGTPIGLTEDYNWHCREPRFAYFRWLIPIGSASNNKAAPAAQTIPPALRAK